MGLLRLNEVNLSEKGQYRCRAENVAGHVELMATLVINSVPRVRLEPSNSVVLRPGARLEISCSVTGDPEPRISWRRMSKTMTDLMTSSPVFIIERVTKEDEGTYSCLATNEAGHVEERLQVMVSDTQELHTPQDRYSEPRIPPSQPRDRYRAPPLTSPPPPLDPYRAPAPSEDAYRVPPSMGYQFQFDEDYEMEEEPIPASSGLVEHEVNTKEGMNVDLTCMNIGTMPGNTQAVWSREDGRDIDRRHKRTEGVLHIRGAKREDAGKYVCQLITSQGDLIFQLVANLVVQGNDY